MAIIIVILLVILLFSMIAHFLKQCGKEGGIAIKIRITIMITNRVGIDGKRGTEYFPGIVSDDREKQDACDPLQSECANAPLRPGPLVVSVSGSDSPARGLQARPIPFPGSGPVRRFSV